MSATNYIDEKPVTTVVENITYTWILKEFNQLTKDYPFELFSPVFPESKPASQWKMKFYHKSRKLDNYCELYLIPVNCDEKETISVEKCSFKIVGFDEKSVIRKGFLASTFTKPFKGLGSDKFCEISEMKKCIFNDELHIQAIVQVKILELNCRHKIEEKNINSILKLTKDLEFFLNSSDLSDFIIKVDDAEIAVHRIILASRSPVFLAMLKNDTSERKSGFVKIKGIHKNTMSSLVRFMYTSKIDFSTIEEAQNLFVAADKYELMDLKDLCENYLIDSLKPFNAIGVLTFSEYYNAFTLKNKIIAYIVKNIHNFITAKRFQKLLKEPSLILEVLEKYHETQN